MGEYDSAEWLSVNCGRCGKSLKMRLEELRDRHTIDCLECEKDLSGRVPATRPTESAVKKTATLLIFRRVRI